MKAIFLDAGYTLLHPVPSLGGIYAEVAETFGVQIPPTRFERAFGPIWDRHAREVLENPDLLRESDTEHRAMWEGFTRQLHAAIPEMVVPFDSWFDRLYQRFGDPQVWTPFPEARQALQTLREQGLWVGVLSNWDSRLEVILEGNGLTPFVHDVVISSQVGYRKPHPEIFRIACARAGVHPEEAVHVGDSWSDDVEGARAANLNPILLCRYNGDLPEGVTAVRSLSELSAVRDLVK